MHPHRQLLLSLLLVLSFLAATLYLCVALADNLQGTHDTSEGEGEGS